MYRHFAFFRQDTGEYIREIEIDAAMPYINPRLSKEIRQHILDSWATEISEPKENEIGLDVTQFDYPLGDFCWMVFDPVSRMLDWPNMHTFIEINRKTGMIFANVQSPRPVRSTENTLIIDITGTPFEQYYGKIFGPVKNIKMLEESKFDDLPIIEIQAERISV